MANSESHNFRCSYTPGIAELLYNLNCTLALSTFQAGKVIFLCAKDKESLVQLPRNFAKPMGIALSGRKMAIACLDEILVLANSPESALNYPKNKNTYDGLFMPRAVYFTGQLDIHDLAWGKDGALYAVNTSFSCIVRIDDNFSFTPVWKPPFISKLASEDHCHLNGMALLNAIPRYATAFSKSDEVHGWKRHLPTGGILMDITENTYIAHSLAMPHSPRIINGDLYLLLSATGELVKIDLNSGKYDVVNQLNGFVRGLCQYGGYVFVGLSAIRKSSSEFRKLPIAEKATQAGVAVIHLHSGKVVGEIRYHSTLEEIYDVQVIPGYRYPGILNTIRPEYKLGLTTPDATFWAQGTS